MKENNNIGMRNYDLTKVITEKHAGKWVALNLERTKVVDFSTDLGELEEKIGNKEVVYMRALPLGVSFSF